MFYKNPLLIFFVVFGIFIIPATSDISYFPLLYPNSSFVDQKVNIILLIGDGMGFEQINLARLTEFGITGLLSFESFPFHLSVSTYSADNAITDSAAAATAFATGSKTNNGFLSLSPNGSYLKTILEYSRDKNMSTGLVTTTELTHATPAAFASHVPSRNLYSDIAKFYADNRSVDVLLGGGKNLFPPDTISTLISNNYTLLENRSELLATNSSKLLGFFSQSSHLPYELDRNRTLTPSLAEMTSKSLEILSDNSNGFFLMVEGGRIDHAGHANDYVRNALETIEFAEAAEVAFDFAVSVPNTLVIVTADHETGSLQILDKNLNDSILPTPFMSDEEAEILRLNRLNNITVSFGSTGHSSQKVGFFGFGSDFYGYTNNSIIDNTQVFDIMYQFLQDPISLSFPSSPMIFRITDKEISFTYGQEGFIVAWQISDDNLYSYELLINNSQIIEQFIVLSSPLNVTYALNGLDVGYYIFKIVVWDLDGLSTNITTNVRVLDVLNFDTTASDDSGINTSKSVTKTTTTSSGFSILSLVFLMVVVFYVTTIRRRK